MEFRLSRNTVYIIPKEKLKVMKIQFGIIENGKRYKVGETTSGKGFL